MEIYFMITCYSETFWFQASEIFVEYAQNQNLSLKSVIFNLATW